jgi:hypothetical protein
MKKICRGCEGTFTTDSKVIKYCPSCRFLRQHKVKDIDLFPDPEKREKEEIFWFKDNIRKTAIVELSLMSDIEEEYIQEDPVIEKICYEELADIVYANLPRGFLGLSDEEDFEEFRNYVMPSDDYCGSETAAGKAERHITFSMTKFYKKRSFPEIYSNRIRIRLNTWRCKVKIEELLLD